MSEEMEQKEYDQPRVNEVAQKYLADLDEERKEILKLSKFPKCALILEEAIDRIYATGRIPGKEFYADVYKQKPMKITQKVFVPVKQYPKFNFTGKILGPKGNSLRRLQEETQCKIAIKGRNSIRDRTKEEDLRNSGDPRYTHLSKDLFVEISTVATPAESYARVAYALAEIRKYLVPDKNDEVSHEQLRELMEIDPQSAKQYSNAASQSRSVFERKFTDGSAPKYMSLIKNDPYGAAHHESEEHDPEMYEYVQRIPKRPTMTGYDYAKARTVPSSSDYKRPPAAPVYATDIKRLREAPQVKSYKPGGGIIKKYK